MHTMGKKKDHTFLELSHHGHDEYVLVTFSHYDHRGTLNLKKFLLVTLWLRIEYE